MLSKSPLHALKGSGVCLVAVRRVHWYHDAKQVGGKTDKYELFNRQREFGQGEVDDKDRYPHLYWNLWKGRTHLQRVVQQWGYSKDHKPDYIRREAEKMAYFMKLDDLDFLEETRPEYNWIDDDANDAVGYVTDDEDDEVAAHKCYGSAYPAADDEYRAMVLDDGCGGRPVFEWQVPYGLHQVFGYQSVATAVDVLCSERQLEATKMHWKPADGEGHGLCLENEDTAQRLVVVDAADAPSAIKQWAPSTVVVQCGAERLLHSVQSAMAPTNSTDVYGCCVATAWSAALFASPLWPSSAPLAVATGTALLALNALFWGRTFVHPEDQKMKKLFAAVRGAKSNLVLGDWLQDDYDERLHQVQPFDDLSRNLEAAPMLTAEGKGSDSTFEEFMRSVRNLGSTSVQQQSLPELTMDDVAKDGWMTSFRDVVNNRRVDLIAHVLNNCEGDRILMAVDDVDNIKSPIVSQLLMRRLTGDVDIGKAPLKYDTYYERVQVHI